MNGTGLGELVGGLFILLFLGWIVFFAFKSRSKNKYYETKYSKLIDIDGEVEKTELVKDEIDKSIEQLRASYKEKKIIFNKLVKETAIYDESIELAELGFYKPHFDFDTSEEFKENIEIVKNKQKEMIYSKEAIYCNTEWMLDGSKANGRAMTNNGIRITARAFNGECDAAISNTNWNNVNTMEQRIEKAFSAINNLNSSRNILISHKFLDLKIEELRLTHEYKEKKQQEKEERINIRRQMREEAKFEKEMKTALKEEEKFNKLLEKAKADAQTTTGSRLDKLQEKISSLTIELEDAHKKSERAKSMAQQTKLGHVYVISNVGSFGEEIYKIGMTRRLDPQDRVKELGDASVPFIFDVHAMISSEDAPELEKQLHKSFNLKRLNLVNNRKEFFNVSLKEIENEVMKISPESEFIATAEARQYRESQAIQLQRENQSVKFDAINELPEAI